MIMSEADSVARRKFEISAATPNNSHISLPFDLKIDLEKRTESEDQNELEETAEKQTEEASETEKDLSTLQKAEEPGEDPKKDSDSVEEFTSPERSGNTEVQQEKATETEIDLSTLQRAEKVEEPEKDPEKDSASVQEYQSSENSGDTEVQQEKATETEIDLSTLQRAEKVEEPEKEPEKDSDSVQEYQSSENSGDTEVVSFVSSFIAQAQQKFSQSEEARDSEEELRPQEGCGDKEDLSGRSSVLSCSSYEHLRQSILKRDRGTSTINFRSVHDLNYCQDLDESLSSIRISCSSSACSVMIGRSLSLTPKSSDGAIGFETNHNWPYFRRSDIDGALSVFKQVDDDKNGYISLCELKRFLEILEIPQTHLKIKKMMAQEVGGSKDRLNFGEALLLYGSLKHRLVPHQWRLHQSEKFAINDKVDVAQVGVGGAKLFFEAKIALQTPKYPGEAINNSAEVLKKPQSEP